MKIPIALSFLAALLCHGLLLFGLRLGTQAKPLPVSDEASSVDVSLVASAPGGVEALSPAPTPVPEPSPIPEQTPQAAPTPVPEAALPSPTPAAEPTAPEPQPEPAIKPTPQPHASLASTPNTHSSAKRIPGPSQATKHFGAQNTNRPGAANSNASSGISARPRYRSNPKPEYPYEAKRNHQEGTAMVSVEVGADGRPKDISLKRSSGFPLLDRAALEAVRRWTFEPASVAGLPVATRVDVPVRFSLAL